MEQTLKFNNGYQKVIITPNEDVTDHSDIDIIIENHKGDDPDNPDVVFLYLKEHEAVYFANTILRFVEQNRLDNERWLADEEKRKK